MYHNKFGFHITLELSKSNIKYDILKQIYWLDTAHKFIEIKPKKQLK